jgi:hypothetical protein
MTTRANFCMRKFSSLVQREELMLAKASGPCRSRIAANRVLTSSSASSHEASRKPAVVGADQGRGEAVVGVGELMRKAALHAGMAQVGRPRAVGLDVHHLAVLHVHVQRAPDPAVRAGGGDLGVGAAEEPGARLLQRRHRALEDALPAAHAPGLLEARVVPRNDPGVVPPALHGQDEGPLHLVARPDAEGAPDALVHLQLDEGVRIVPGGIVGAGVLVAGRAEPHLLRQVLEFAAPVGRAVQALQGVIRDDEFGDVPPKPGQEGGVGPVHRPLGHRGVARGHGPAPLHLHEAGPAGPVGLHPVGVAERGDVPAGGPEGREDRAPRGTVTWAPFTVTVTGAGRPGPW